MKSLNKIRPPGSVFVELMLVVAILGFLPALAVAKFIHPRSLFLSRSYFHRFRRSNQGSGEAEQTPDLALRMFLAWTAFVQPVAVQWWRRKWRSLLPSPQDQRVIRRFGQAQLVRFSNGQHELIGGTAGDRAAAFEWASVFAHGVVFPPCQRDAPTSSISPQSHFPPQLQSLMGSAW